MIMLLKTQEPFYEHWSTLIVTCISNHMSSKVRDVRPCWDHMSKRGPYWVKPYDIIKTPTCMRCWLGPITIRIHIYHIYIYIYIYWTSPGYIHTHTDTCILMSLVSLLVTFSPTLTRKMSSGVHFCSWKLAYIPLDMWQMKPDKKHLHITYLTLQIISNILIICNYADCVI